MSVCTSINSAVPCIIQYVAPEAHVVCRYIYEEVTPTLRGPAPLPKFTDVRCTWGTWYTGTGIVECVGIAVDLQHGGGRVPVF